MPAAPPSGRLQAGRPGPVRSTASRSTVSPTCSASSQRLGRRPADLRRRAAGSGHDAAEATPRRRRMSPRRSATRGRRCSASRPARTIRPTGATELRRLPGSFRLAASETWYVVERTMSYVGGLFVGRESPDQLSGPIGIAEVRRDGQDRLRRAAESGGDSVDLDRSASTCCRSRCSTAGICSIYAVEAAARPAAERTGAGISGSGSGWRSWRC